MRFDKLTIKSQEALSEAQSLASKQGHGAVEPAHLLRTLLAQPEGVTGPILEKLGVPAVRLLGADPWGNPDLFRRVGYCPETDSVYPDLSAPEFIASMLRLSGLERGAAAQEARAALTRVGLDPEIPKPMAAFSKGMRQRAKLAQALALAPEVLLLDEPLNGMDPLGRRETIDLLSSLGARDTPCSYRATSYPKSSR